MDDPPKGAKPINWKEAGGIAHAVLPGEMFCAYKPETGGLALLTDHPHGNLGQGFKHLRLGESSSGEPHLFYAGDRQKVLDLFPESLHSAIRSAIV